MKNIIVFFSDIQDKQILIDSINQDTLYIEYNSNTANDTLLQLVTSETECIGLLYHHYGYNNIPFFNNDYNDEIDMDFSCCDKNYSSNFVLIRTQFIKLICDLKKINSNIIIDLITCNVNDISFIEELSKLKLVVRYSTNPAGNLSDWVQESHNINIKNIYFNEKINMWDHLLVIYLNTDESQILALTRAAYGMKVVYPGYTGPIIKVRKNIIYSSYNLQSSNWVLTRSGGSSAVENLVYNEVRTRLYYSITNSYGANWTFRNVSPIAQTITLNWIYSCCHSFYKATANTYFWRGSTATNVGTMRNGSVGCTSTYSGTVSFSVSAGQAWGIYASGSHFDGTKVLNGTIYLWETNGPTPIDDFFGNENSETLINSNNVTLQDWLGTDDGYVIYWYDQSPNALHLSEAYPNFQPQFNKVNNSILFNNKRLYRGGVLPASVSSYTYLATYKLNSLLNNQVIMEHSLSALTTNRRASMMSINGKLSFAGQDNDLTNIVSLTTNDFNKTILLVNKSVNPVINVNHNDNVYSGNTLTPADLNIGTDRFLLGVNTTTTNQYFNGEIKYVVVINGALNMSKTVSFFEKIQYIIGTIPNYMPNISLNNTYDALISSNQDTSNYILSISQQLLEINSNTIVSSYQDTSNYILSCSRILQSQWTLSETTPNSNYISAFDGKIKVYRHKITIPADFYNDTYDMILWCKFNGNVNDSSENNYILTAVVNTGTATYSFTNKKYDSTSLDVVNTYYTNNLIDLNGKDFTLCLWVYKRTGVQWFLTFGNSTTVRNLMHIGCRSAYNLVLGLYGDDLDVYNLPDDTNRWVHLTYSYEWSSRTMKIYRNGVIAGTKTAGGNPSYTTGTFKIFSSFTAEYCNALIDDYRLYDRVLSEDEISVLSGDFYKSTMNMLLWCEFDGNVNDSSGNNYTLTAVAVVANEGTVSYDLINKKSGSSSLDVYKTYYTNNLINLNGISFTLCLWVYKRAGPQWFLSFGTAGSTRTWLHIGCRNATNIILGLYSDDLELTVPDDTNKWVHLTYSYEWGTRAMKIYRNGVLLGTRTAGGNPSYGTGGFRMLAGINNTTTDYCNALIDDYRLYNTVLTQNEITIIYNQTIRQTVEADLVTYNDLSKYATYSQLQTKQDILTAGSGITISGNTISGFNSNYNNLTNKPVLFDGNYNSLTNKLIAGSNILISGNNTISAIHPYWSNSIDVSSIKYISTFDEKIKIYENKIAFLNTLPQPTVIGSTITQISGTNYYYASFTSTSGTNTIRFNQNIVCNVFIIGGGGGGGFNHSGGGGAGAYYFGNVVFEGKITYSVTVGAGGAGGTSSIKPSNGYPSYINNGTSNVLLYVKGGGAGGQTNGSDNNLGKDGGCGGGANGWDGNSANNVTYAGGSAVNMGTNGLGYGGGASINYYNGYKLGGGGGGGIGGIGSTSMIGEGGNGGNALKINIKGVDEAYGGGGGGGTGTNWGGIAGLGGGVLINGITVRVGGNGVITPEGANGGNGVINTGSGGGSAKGGTGGSGSAGIVIIRWSSIQDFQLATVYEPYLTFGTSKTDRMIITSYGNIGIGTNIPQYSLDINGSLNCTSLYVNNEVFNSNAFTNSLSTLTNLSNKVQVDNNTITFKDYIMPTVTNGIINQITGTEYYYAIFTDTTSAIKTINFLEDTVCDILVVGGGGGGGYRHGAGGGAGGLVYSQNVTFSTGNYNVVVGNGGTGATSGSVNGSKGSNSSVNGITAIGGGGGMSWGATFDANIQNGGSGGGGTLSNNYGSGTTNQGYSGGKGSDDDNYNHGGGGGAGQVGQDGTYDKPGNGGNGLQISITGSSVWYAGGGGGGSQDSFWELNGPQSSGGQGGGGKGGIPGVNNSGENGVANTGGGGGGASTSSGGNSNGGTGGSGVVIIRWRVSTIKIKIKIGETVSTDARLCVASGSISTGTTNLRYFNYDTTSLTTTNTSITDNCAVFDSSIWVKSSIASSSDIRIKKNIKDIDDDDALNKILSIEPKTYDYVDQLERGTSNVYGFIAQQIKEVIPNAVKLERAIVPNIYSIASCEGSKIYLTSNKDISDILSNNINLKTIDVSGKENINKIINYTSNSITIDNTIGTSKIFVYGTEIEDFHIIDKSYIYTLNVCATQILSRKIDTLQEENDMLTQENEKLKQEILNIKSYLKIN